MRIRILIVLFLIMLIGCKKQVNEKEYSDFFETVKNSEINLLINEIDIDSIFISNIETSFTGNIIINNDLIHFVDSRFGWVFIFDKDGNLLSKKLGQGRGPMEIPIKRIDAFCFLPDARKIFIGSSLDCYVYNKDWERINTFIIDKNINLEDMKKPEPDNPNIYTFDYENFNIRHDSKGNIYAPIYSELKKFNPLSSYKYYTEGRILIKINLKSEKTVAILGRRSPEYLKYKYLGHHAFFYYDIDSNNNFYISHEIDSLIYVYDNEFNIIRAFGRSGKNMDNNYKELPVMDFKEFRNLYFNDRPKRGYYSSIKLFEDKELLFRIYKKGEKSKTDGLQIYHQDVLIADIDVPKEIEIAGYISPYFYSNVLIDEINEEIKIFRFRLPI